MSRDANARSGEFIDLLDALMAECDLVSIIQAAFDESYGDSDVLSVAGFIFTKRGARGLTREWGNMLKKSGRNLPFFRMSACAHGNPPFERLSRDKRDKVAREAIALIKKHAFAYAITTVNEREFVEKVPNQSDQFGHSSAYAFCVWNCLFHVQAACREYGLAGRKVYLFEAGHRHQSDANRIMNGIFEVPSLREDYEYKSHAFVDKDESALVQAADLLAWQAYQDRLRELDGRPRRKDMASLVQMNGVVRHIDVDAHAETVRRVTAQVITERAASL